jgi:hypothetical protein
MWMPMPVPPKRTITITDPWPLLGFWTRVVGFFLLFAGAIVVVAGATPGGNCYSSSGCSGFLSQAANAVLAARILWVLGLGALGAGSAIRLHWGLRMPEGAKPEDVTWAIADRRTNALIFIVCVVLLFVIFLVSGAFDLLGAVATAPIPTPPT